MSAAGLSMDLLRELLPAGEAAAFGSIRLEMTPHRAFRFVLLDHGGRPAAIAELDESAERCLPREPEALSDALQGMLPQPLFHGELAGRPVCVRPFFEGRSLDESGHGDAKRLEIAEELLGIVQSERRGRRHFDEVEFERLAAGPLTTIRGSARFASEFSARLDPWESHARALLGHELDYSLHHGDFQFSNLLLAQDGSHQIIDWELSRGEAPVWMDRAHLAIAHIASMNRCGYGEAALTLRQALGANPAGLPYSFSQEAMSLEPAVRRGAFLLCVLHGMSHFLRRVPHLSGPERIEDFLRAGDAFLEL